MPFLKFPIQRVLLFPFSESTISDENVNVFELTHKQTLKAIASRAFTFIKRRREFEHQHQCYSRVTDFRVLANGSVRAKVNAHIPNTGNKKLLLNKS